jgi:phosphonoacetaldehyde hydrolase
MENIKGIICDWAGTVVDYGCIAPVKVFVDLFAEYGIEISMDAARGPMGLAKKDHTAQILFSDEVKEKWSAKYGKEPADSDLEELYSKIAPMMEEIAPKFSDPIPGAAEFIAKLREQGIKFGSTTGYVTSMMDKIIPVAAEKGLIFDSVVNPDDVPAGRPYPWMCYLNSMNIEAFPMSAMVKIGDTLADVKEGLNAGMWIIGITKTGNEVGLSQEEMANKPEEEVNSLIEAAAEKLKNAGAHYIAESVAACGEILAEIDKRIANGERP